MRRGLKSELAQASEGPATDVAEDSPMRRGLKCTRRWSTTDCRLYCRRRFPDEEGTEIDEKDAAAGGFDRGRRRFPDEEGTEIVYACLCVAKKPNVAEDSPMRRGLKCLGLANGLIQFSSPVAEDSPMRRGLKLEPWSTHVWLNADVAEDSPMRRGLKSGRTNYIATNSSHVAEDSP